MRFKSKEVWQAYKWLLFNKTFEQSIITALYESFFKKCAMLQQFFSDQNFEYWIVKSVVGYQVVPSIIAQIQIDNSQSKDGKITNYLRILQQLGPPTYCQKEKNVLEWAGGIQEQDSPTVVVQILRVLRKFSSLRLRYCNKQWYSGLLTVIMAS